MTPMEARMTEQAAGPLADELARLMASVQEWARRSLGESPPEGYVDPVCQWCPICQFVALLRGDRPDVTEKVTEAGTALVTAMQALLNAAGHAAHSAPAEPEPRVQKIDLGDDGV
jgi:hypothetical protein